VDVLAAVDTIWQTDFGGMWFLQGHKGEKYKGSRRRPWKRKKTVLES